METSSRSVLARVALCPAGVLAAAALACAPREEPTARQTSVMLVSLDTTRADALGCYGGPSWCTPHLDALAARGVRFDQARSVTPVTLPSHASLLTGRLPFEHGVRDNGTFVLPGEATTLAERLGAQGYRTGAVVAAFVLHSSFGLAQGFDVYSDAPRRRLESAGPSEERSAAQVVVEARRFLDAQPPGEPFFLWVHFFDPHFPYVPPAEVVAALPADADPEAAPNRREARRRRYLAEVATVDRACGQLLDALEPFGGQQEVLVVVVADHGEGLGEHGEATHSSLIHDATLRIPLLLRHGDLPAGLVVSEPVSIVDVAPTILALLGLPTGETSGADLSPLLAGHGLDIQRPLYLETCTPWLVHGWTPLYGVVEGRWKTIVGPQAELFDLVEDPGELDDRALDHPDVVERARRRLSGLAGRTVPSQRRDLDESELESLRALGYAVAAAADGEPQLVPGWIPEGARHPRDGLEVMARFTKAQRQWVSGREEPALALLRALVAEERSDQYLLTNVGALLVEAGELQEALPLLRRALELAPHPGTSASLAACLVRLDRRAEALAVLEAGVDQHPAYLQLRLTLGDLLVREGRGSEAIPHLEAFLRQISPDSPLVLQAQKLLEAASGGE